MIAFVQGKDNVPWSLSFSTKFQRPQPSQVFWGQVGRLWLWASRRADVAVRQDILGYQIRLKLKLWMLGHFLSLIRLPRNSQVETTTWQSSSALSFFLGTFGGPYLPESSSFAPINILCQEKDNGNCSERGRIVRRRTVDGECLLF